jgi:hypothetical protein
LQRTALCAAAEPERCIHMKSITAILLVLFLLPVSCSPFDGPNLPASDEVLAQNLRIKIGGYILTAPAIVFLVSTTRTKIINSVNSQGHEIALTIDQLLNRRSKENNLIKALSIDFHMDSLRSLQDTKTDIHISTTNSFCQKLNQQWAKNQCISGLYDNYNVFLPRRFTLIEKTHLLNNFPDISFYSGNFISVGEAARLMLKQNKFPNRNCEVNDTGAENRLCTHIDKIDENLFIVWIAIKSENYPGNFNNPKNFAETELLDKEQQIKNK